MLFHIQDIRIMAVIEKMAICGIRSYNPNEHSVIEFQTPLTLLVGQNGCGKTVSLFNFDFMNLVEGDLKQKWMALLNGKEFHL